MSDSDTHTPANMRVGNERVTGNSSVEYECTLEPLA